MPRSSYITSLADQALVHELAAIGMSEDDIAVQLRLPLRKLQRRFPLEIKRGAASGREHLLRKLHAIAISGENINAMIFSVKSRCGWRDTGPSQSAVKVIRRLIEFKPKPKPAIQEQPR